MHAHETTRNMPVKAKDNMYITILYTVRSLGIIKRYFNSSTKLMLGAAFSTDCEFFHFNYETCKFGEEKKLHFLNLYELIPRSS